MITELQNSGDLSAVIQSQMMQHIMDSDDPNQAMHDVNMNCMLIGIAGLCHTMHPEDIRRIANACIDDSMKEWQAAARGENAN